MGAALSSKFTSVLTVGFVGLRVLERLLGQVSDATIRVEVVIKHFLSTFTLLGLIPILIYLLIFQIHFIILEHSGPFDYFFSSLLQSTLVGNPLHNITAPQYIFSGTVVSLRNCQSGSGYLHSHLYTYPKTISELQQVTGYTHADSNNLWLIEKFHNIPDNLSDSQRLSLGDGDLIQLRHLKTNGTLEVQSLSAPLSKRNYLVGVNNAGSDNNGTKWQLKAIRRSGPIRNLIDRFQLISVDPSCVLTVGNRQLPKWGSHQSEISCDRRRNRPADVSHWVAGAQEKLFPDQSDVKMSELGPSFLEKMTEVHSVMLQINSRFKAELGEESSAPLYWPLNLFGQTLMTKSDRIYMMGNPVIWWFIAPFLLLFPFIFITVLAVVKRQLVCGNKEASKALNLQLLKEAGWLWLGWAIHYAPFFLMSRILYFHHYYPAFIFSCLFSGTLVGWIILTFLPFKLRQPILTIFVLVISGSFCFFYPLAYGMKPGKNYNHLRWLQSWNF